MSQGAKDSVEVIEFMKLFARLKDWCEDAPDELADFVTTDTSVKDPVGGCGDRVNRQFVFINECHADSGIKLTTRCL